MVEQEHQARSSMSGARLYFRVLPLSQANSTRQWSLIHLTLITELFISALIFKVSAFLTAIGSGRTGFVYGKFTTLFNLTETLFYSPRHESAKCEGITADETGVWIVGLT